MTDRLLLRQQAFLAALRGDHADLGWIAQADASRRVAVYRSAIEHNWRAAMQAVYPVCQAWVGAAFFNEAVRQHLAQSPPTSGDLHDLGDGFAGFLAHYIPAAGQPMLPDLARLEWAVHRAFHAADPDPLPLSSLATVAQDELPRLVLRLLPGTALISAAWPVLDLWKAHQPGGNTRDPDLHVARAQQVLVWRDGFETALTCLDDCEACLVVNALAGRSVLAALQAAPFPDTPDAGNRLGQGLRTLFDLGLVAHLDLLPG